MKIARLMYFGFYEAGKKGHSRINGCALYENLIYFTTKFTTRFGT